MKRKVLTFALLGTLMLCCACGEGGPAAGTAAPGEPPDLSGTYTDRQGTEEIDSQLELTRQADGLYRFSMGLHRITTLEGDAAYQEGILHFASGDPHVEGNLSVSGQTAEAVITVSDFPEIAAGTIYRFPDGP